MSLQIVIQQTSKQLYNVGLYGKYELKLNNIMYSDSRPAANNYLIQFASDRLKLPFSADPGYNNAGAFSGGRSQRCFVMDTIQKQTNNNNNPVSFICTLDGVIDIELQDFSTATTALQGTFNWCVLNFDVRKLD